MLLDFYQIDFYILNNHEVTVDNNRDVTVQGSILDAGLHLQNNLYHLVLFLLEFFTCATCHYTL